MPRSHPVRLLLLSVFLAGACRDSSDPVMDPVDERWSQGPPLPVALMSHAAAGYQGAVYVAAGESPSGPSLAVFRHVPGTDEWERLSDLDDFRVGGKMVVVDGRLYLVGGSTVVFGSLLPSRHVEYYVPAEDRWQEVARFPDLRNGDPVPVPGGVAVVGGGFGSDEHGGTFPGDSVALYDVAADAWRYGSPIPTPRNRPMAVAFGPRVHVFGGTRLDVQEIPLEIDVYDAGTDGWTTEGALFPDFIQVLNMAYGPLAGRAHFLGGQLFAEGLPAVNVHVRYDVASRRWEEAPLLPTPRGNAATAELDGKLYVIGGIRAVRGTPGAFTAAVEIYDPAGTT